MRISVVIATYNRATLLADCLAHLARQAYEEGDEVIVVDNASQDDTRQVIERAAARSPVPLRYVSIATPGKTPALNAGIEAATGDVLALTDDDVLVADDWIQTVRAMFGDPGLALAGGRVDPRWARPAPGWLRVDPLRPYGRMTSPLALLHYGERQELGQRTAVGANLAVRREVLEVVGGFAPGLGRQRRSLLCGEDHEFCRRVIAAGYRCEYRPELRVRHWVPGERLTLRYYVRWFYWSGVTNARIDSAGMTGTAGLRSRAYWWRRLLTAPIAAAVRLVTHGPPDAVAALVDGAFALGYFLERTKDRRTRTEPMVMKPAPPARAGGGGRTATGGS